MAKQSKAKKKRWTAHDVQGMLPKLFPSGSHALLQELRNGTGFSRNQVRTADAVAVSCWPSRGLHLAGIEIKVSRSDWNKELANPKKAEGIQQFCKYWYVAVPKGLVTEGEVPENWGLIECDRTARIVKAAPLLEHKPPDMLLVCSILRSVSEQYTPTSSVHAQIETEVTRRLDNQAENYELSHLKEKIEVFEEASGVNISDHWNAEGIGLAVKFVREVGVDRAVWQTTRLQKEHQCHADLLQKLLDEVARKEST